MNYRRGDVLLAFFPHSLGKEVTRRPVVVVQNDVYNQGLDNLIVAQITSNLSRRDDDAHLLIDLADPESHLSGLLTNSLVSGNNLVTLHRESIDHKIGSLGPRLLQQLEECLKSALALS